MPLGTVYLIFYLPRNIARSQALCKAVVLKTGNPVKVNNARVRDVMTYLSSKRGSTNKSTGICAG